MAYCEIPNCLAIARFEAVEVPTGFVTDLASIPRILFSALRPDGVYAYAAIIHDYLYWKQDRPREEANEILRMSMIDFNVDRATVFAIYEGVGVGGAAAWASNARLRALGEKRELTQFPPNARTSWAPDVFAP